MTSGILLSILTGLTWTAIGIVLSRCARGSFDLLAYSLLQTLCSGITALLLYTDPNGLPSTTLALPALILSAGCINALAQYYVRQSMTAGNHAPIWAMMQAAMLLPFFAGILLFHTRPSIPQYIGITLLILGVFLPSLHPSKSPKSWRRPAWIAFLLYGILQTLYLLPSHLPLFHDPAGLRPALACFGNLSGWILITASHHHKPTFSPKAIIIAATMTLIHVIGSKTFFSSIDILAHSNASAMAIPLMQGANIIAFSLYSISLHQKHSLREFSALFLMLLGFLLLAL